MHPANVLLLSIVLTSIVAPRVQAQDDGGSTSSGISIGGDAVATVMRTRPVAASKETPTGVGLRANVSYGVTDDWAVFGALQTVSIRTGSASALKHAEAGVRLTLLDDGFAARPYFEAALAMRQITTRLARPGNTFADVNSVGGAAILGGGVQLFVSPRLAVDVGLVVTTGSFRNPRIDGERVPVLDGSVPSTSLRLGMKYFLTGSNKAF